MERKRFVYCLLVVHKGKAKSKHLQNMPNFVTSASPLCAALHGPTTLPRCPALIAKISKLKMVEISSGRKLVRKNQSCTQIVLPFTDVR